MRRPLWPIPGTQARGRAQEIPCQHEAQARGPQRTPNPCKSTALSLLTVTLVGQEKSVDVRIALGIERFALEARNDIALIFSHDQDLSEAVQETKYYYQVLL